MATPLGHVLVGMVTYSVVCPGERWQLAGALGCGLLTFSPDLDVLLSVAVSGKVGTFHRQFTHHPAFALLSFLGVLGLGFLTKRELTPQMISWAALAGFLILSHCLMDSWVRLPYFGRLWSKESSFLELLALELQRPSIFNYLIDLVVYGAAYTVLVFPLASFVRRVGYIIAR